MGGKSLSSGFGSDATLRGSPSPTPRPRAHTTGDFSYENTPVSAVGEGNGLGIGIEVHSPGTPSLYSNNGEGVSGNGKGVLKEKSSYKSLGVMDERDYDGSSYGIQQPARAKTVSFGEHGHIG
jgi:hypothetical protein